MFKKLGATITRLREEKGFVQTPKTVARTNCFKAMVAFKSDIPFKESTYSRIESGNVYNLSPEILTYLAKFFETPEMPFPELLALFKDMIESDRVPERSQIKRFIGTYFKISYHHTHANIVDLKRISLTETSGKNCLRADMQEKNNLYIYEGEFKQVGSTFKRIYYIDFTEVREKTGKLYMTFSWHIGVPYLQGVYTGLTGAGIPFMRKVLLLRLPNDTTGNSLLSKYSENSRLILPEEESNLKDLIKSCVERTSDGEVYRENMARKAIDYLQDCTMVNPGVLKIQL